MWTLIFTHRIEFHHAARIVRLTKHTQLIRIVALWYERQAGWRSSTTTIRGRRGGKLGTFIRWCVLHVKSCQILRITFRKLPIGRTSRCTRWTNLHRQGTVLRGIFARFHKPFHVVLEWFLLSIFHWTILWLWWIFHITILETIIAMSIFDMAFVGRFHGQIFWIILVLRRSVTLPGCAAFPHKLGLRFYFNL